MNKQTKFKQTDIGPIPEEWGFDLLKDHCSHIQYGFTQSASLEEVGPKFLRITDIQNSHVDWDSVPFCEISKQEHEKYKLQPNDIVIARTGASTGVNTIYKKGSPDSVFASYLIRIKTDERLDPLFTYYFLQSDYYKEYVAGILGGSAQPNANAQQLTEINLPIPRSVVEQSRIASILSSLDDKIELNRKMNANLERIASALFKRWFVDFEFPNAEGKPYKTSGGRMVESELGEIPEGWGVGRLGSEFDIIMGQSPSGDTYNEIGEGMPFYQGRTDFGFRFPTRRVFCSDPQRTAKKLDTLISVRAPVGDVNMACEECCIGRGVGAIRRERFSSYTLYMVKSLQDQISQFDSEGTVFGSINKNSLANIACVVPNSRLITEFEILASCMDKQIFDFSQEIAILIEMRDSFLPRLVSGRIRVK